MKKRLSISDKVLILNSVPLIFMLGLIGLLGYLHNEAEKQAVRAERARQVVEAINQLEKDLLITAGSRDQKDIPVFLISKFEDAIDDARKQFDTLTDLVKDDPAKRRVVENSFAIGKQAFEVLQQAITLYRQDMFTPQNQRKFEILKRLRTYVKGIFSDELLNLASEEKQAAREGTEAQAGFREALQWAGVGGALVVIVVTFGIAMILVRQVAGRLDVVKNNTIRLASRAPLNKIMPGDDEIADIDKAFHTMSSALAEAHEKERALIDNALDVIYSLDDKGSFIEVNDACATVFGYTPSELIGSKFVNLAVTDTMTDIANYLKLITEGHSEPPFETQLKRKDGRVIDIRWSARWSSKDKTIFCVAHDITERKQAERLRQEIVQMVIHDLRTPLTTIQGFHNLLESGRAGTLSDQGQSLLGIAERNVFRMSKLVEDLLIIERLDAGALELHKTEAALDSIFEQSEAAVSAALTEKAISLKRPPTKLQIYADEDRILQVLVNLLGNAIKFSPRGSSIELSAQQLPEAVEIKVTDHGRGIPANMLGSIFERFRQVCPSDSSEKRGSGLGLAICKALMELHGGTIAVQSTEGSGSTFLLSIPSTPQSALSTT